MKPEEMLTVVLGPAPTVEINNLLSNAESAAVLENWARRHREFRFSIKASRRITHMARMKPTLPTRSTFFTPHGGARREARSGASQLPPMLKIDPSAG